LSPEVTRSIIGAFQRGAFLTVTLRQFLNLVEFGMTVQEAGEAPRFRHTGGEVGLESGIGAVVRRDLIRRGHKIVTPVDAFGGYQGILIDPGSGVLMGGSDPRKDGCAMGW
jgi:gamma-glutamyltranspeptidase/glutathione hydrolase